MPTGAVTVTVTSGSSLGGSATVTITAAAAGGVAISPASRRASGRRTKFQFAATVNGAAATVTSWQVNGVSGGDSLHGMIDTLGNYTAPAVPPPGGSTTITAITASGSATSNATIVFRITPSAGRMHSPIQATTVAVSWLWRAVSQRKAEEHSPVRRTVPTGLRFSLPRKSAECSQSGLMVVAQ